MAVCSEIHTKHINTVCGQNVELLNVKLAVHIVTTGLSSVAVHTVQHMAMQGFRCGRNAVPVLSTAHVISKYKICGSQSHITDQSFFHDITPCQQ